MFFEQILDRLPFLNNNKFNQRRKKNNALLLNPSRDESERLLIEKVENLIADEKYNLALDLIEATTKNKIQSNLLLSKKAFLLSQAKKYEEAETLWRQLSELQSDPQLAAAAKQSLETSKKIRLEIARTTQLLIKNLHAIARQYQRKLKHLVEPEDFSPTTDIIPLIHKEAKLARNADLPKLSSDLIDQALNAGLESPLLLLGKALSLRMMGQQEQALELLTGLNETIKNTNFQDSVNTAIEEINKNPKPNPSKTIRYLVKQSRLSAIAAGLEIQFIPDVKTTTDTKNVKFLIFKEARTALDEKPEATLGLMNSVLDYFHGDLAALQLKGEALAKLNQIDQAIQVWKNLIHSPNKDIAKTANNLISQYLTQQALSISSNKSPRLAIVHYIEKHLAHSITPTLNEEIKTIIKKQDDIDNDSLTPELQEHQLQLLFNTMVIECLEAQLREQDRSNAGASAQKPDAIRKTAPKAG